MKSRFLVLFFISVISGLCCFPVDTGAAEPGKAEMLSIVEAFRLAIDHDASHAMAHQQYQADLELLPQAQAGFLPQLSLEGSQAMSDYQNPSNTLTSPVLNNTVGVYLVQALYQRNLFYGYKKAKGQVSVAELRYEEDRQRLALEIVENYLSIIRLSHERQLALGELENYKVRWQQADAALNLGRASLADMLEAKSRLEETEVRLLLIKRDRNKNVRNLKRLVGVTVAVDEMFSWSEQYQPLEWESEEWLALAKENNLGVKIARLEKKIGQSLLEERRSAHFPTLTLNASISDRDHDDLGVTQGSEAKISLGLKLPLYQGGRTISTVRQARSFLRQSEEKLRGTLELTSLNVQEIIDNLLTGKENIAVWREILAARTNALEAAEESHRLGFKDLIALLDTQSRLNLTLRELNNSIYDHLVQVARLHSATGLLDIEALKKIDSTLLPLSLLKKSASLSGNSQYRR